VRKLSFPKGDKRGARKGHITASASQWFAGQHSLASYDATEDVGIVKNSHCHDRSFGQLRSAFQAEYQATDQESLSKWSLYAAYVMLHG
jgi:hypothetical protein